MPKAEKDSFEAFVSLIQDAVDKGAKEKGYNRTGVEGKNEMFQFLNGTVAPNDSHALGEIIYKAVRYSNKHDKTDLVKIAAWAFLIWKHGEA